MLEKSVKFETFQNLSSVQKKLESLRGFCYTEFEESIWMSALD